MRRAFSALPKARRCPPGDQAHHLMPVLADDIHLDASTQERLEGRVSCRRLDAGQLPVGEVAQPGAEAEAEHDAESEDMVRYAPRVDVVGVDLQAGAMVQ